MNKTATLALAALIPATALAGATASNFKKDSRKPANFYNANSAIDGKPETAWMVPGESANRGEWIMLDIPKGDIDKIAIMPGWAKSDETWTDHPRVKRLKVEVMCCADSDQMTSTFTTHVDLADKKELQIIDIEDAHVGNELFGGKVKLSVVDIYEGVDFPNMGISEVSIMMKEFDAAGPITGSSDENPDHITMDMQDDNRKTFWASPAEGAFFTFEAEGYGISSVQITDGPAGYARAKKVKVIANDREHITEIPDKAGTHNLLVPSIYGYSGSAWGEIKVEILEVYPGSKGEVAISEMKIKATNYEGI